MGPWYNRCGTRSRIVQQYSTQVAYGQETQSPTHWLCVWMGTYGRIQVSLSESALLVWNKLFYFKIKQMRLLETEKCIILLSALPNSDFTTSMT